MRYKVVKLAGGSFPRQTLRQSQILWLLALLALFFNSCFKRFGLSSTLRAVFSFSTSCSPVVCSLEIL